MDKWWTRPNRNCQSHPIFWIGPSRTPARCPINQSPMTTWIINQPRSLPKVTAANLVRGSKRSSAPLWIWSQITSTQSLSWPIVRWLVLSQRIRAALSLEDRVCTRQLLTTFWIKAKNRIDPIAARCSASNQTVWPLVIAWVATLTSMRRTNNNSLTTHSMAPTAAAKDNKTINSIRPSFLAFRKRVVTISTYATSRDNNSLDREEWRETIRNSRTSGPSKHRWDSFNSISWNKKLFLELLLSRRSSPIRWTPCKYLPSRVRNAWAANLKTQEMLTRSNPQLSWYRRDREPKALLITTSRIRGSSNTLAPTNRLASSAAWVPT